MANIDGGPGTSDSLKTFGAVLKVFRERAALTREQLAEEVIYSPHTISSIEQGRRMPPEDFVERAEEILDAFGVLRVAARNVARQPGLAAWFRLWAQLEKTAVTLCIYECRVVPGLLQTEAYARAVMLDVPPPPTEKELAERIAARLARKELLRREPPIALSFIIEEAVLLRRTGGDEVTREQLDHLIECARLWNVEIQIMPLRQPHHAGTDGPMQLMETREHRWIGYAEGQQTGQLVAGPKDVSLMQMRYARMRSQALSPADSVELLKRMRGEL
ncbi:helix-turn-helix domain-containing protein [Streptomyces fenghuangensis]|uniref:helix-turn-helix domain-containing protein n=1 Tax=Streptomyces sp. ICN903 TaxID=2964654 RepID=UPI001EDBEF55|nr:helix-turn-helix transcriptional regulator [Streptomyces sp. ICN903]MCG3042951.1 helix-turn-helix domain-containing protein [Streptomyces sp. ICN903]